MTSKILPDPDGSGMLNVLTSPVYHYTYDVLGRMVTMTDPLARVTEYVYNAAGQLYQTITPDHDGDTYNTVTEFGYDAAGRLNETIDALGNSHTVVFDELGRVIETHEPSPDGIAAGPVFATTYGATGWTLTSTDPLNNVTQYAYSNFGRTVTTVQPNAATGATGTGPETISEYDPVGNLISFTDANGGVTTYEYDDLDRLISVAQPDPTNDMVVNPPVTSFAYDKLGRKVSQTDPLGNVTSYDYDERGRLVLVTQADPDGGGALTAPETQYEYDDAGQLLSVTNALGDETTYVYDYLGRMITQTQPDPDGAGPLTTLATTYEYDAVGNLLQVTDPLGNYTQYAFDAHNNLVEITMPDPDDAGSLTSPVWTCTFDDLGNKLTSTDPMTRVTTYEYDNLNRLTRETSPDPDGVGSQLAPRMDYVYDIAGNLLTVTDRLSHVTTYAYDHLHRQTSVTNANSEVTTFTYDDAGNRLTLTDPESNTTTWVYDALNRAVTETNELSDARTFAYDNASNLVKKTDRLGRVTEYVYDDLHRRTAELWKNGGSTVRTFAYSYDPLGQLLNADDPSAEFDYVYDPVGRVTEITSDLAGQTDDFSLTQTFDAMGNRTALSAQLGSTLDFLNSYSYDDLYRTKWIKQEDQPSGNTIRDKRVDFAYNAASQFDSLTRYHDLAGTDVVATTDYAYDDAGRLTLLDHWYNSTHLAGYEYVYDAASRITSIDSFLDGLTDYTHDDSGQLTDADHTGATDETYVYDDNGNRVMSGHTVGDNNQLLTDGVYDYDYDAEGNRIRRTRISDDLVEEYHWDYRNRLTSVITCGGTTDLAYDEDSVIEHGVGYGCGDGVGYDGSGQQMPTWANGYSSTVWGSFTVSGYTVGYNIYNYNSAEGSMSGYAQIFLDASVPVDLDFTFYSMGYTASGGVDFDGFMTNVHIGAGNTAGSYTYFTIYNDGLDEADEIFNVVASVSTMGATGTTTIYLYSYIYDNDEPSIPAGAPQLVAYEYDYLNRLTQRTVSEWDDVVEEHSYDYDGMQIVMRRDDNGDAINHYLWGPQVDQLLADEQAGLLSGWTSIWPLADHLGTLRDILLHHGGDMQFTSRVNHREYDSFGNLTDESDPTYDLLFGYTGRLFDEVTGLQNNLNRWYDARTGQWMSEDPIGFAALDSNINRYVRNQVLSSVDPSGLMDLWFHWYYNRGGNDVTISNSNTWATFWQRIVNATETQRTFKKLEARHVAEFETAVSEGPNKAGTVDIEYSEAYDYARGMVYSVVNGVAEYSAGSMTGETDGNAQNTTTLYALGGGNMDAAGKLKWLTGPITTLNGESGYWAGQSSVKRR